ncbi:alpha/beta hydrolase fold protein [Kribbella flavida DSM 17836]|uniref:Alpha/beta hydrolase fold protein n=1 Tax=Kribbella flavida (strain DSM 17836 / JCM 10339 / NBRC 14399) TaxID=479435 RepID=D2Q010_KRIFD|nr:alpha/beta hydrolase [Kribbella flavida]ADB30008.1 alpha/beta hydrolase fold protein [Kribbella flavida DSM 17836]
MFDNFQLDRITVGEVPLRVRHGGSGPAVVLLHGHPRTHTTWYAVAPRLAAAGFTVVCPDLRGYGQSGKPPTDADHTPYSKRAMANDLVGLMDALGHATFSVVGHDRGSYVAYRTALDHPERVAKLVVIDGVPAVEALERTDAKFAAQWWHWWFFAQSEKPAERVICADPDAWYNAWTSNGPDALGPENHADFLAAIRDPATVHGMLEDYRAGLGIDRRTDEQDRAAGRQIRCPAMMLWSTRDDMEEIYGDPLEVWKPWCPQIVGHGIDSTHHVAENAPAELVKSLAEFL